MIAGLRVLGRRLRDSGMIRPAILADAPDAGDALVAEAVVRNARTADGTGLVVSSSRAILYASPGDDYAEAAARAARDLRDTLNRAR